MAIQTSRRGKRLVLISSCIVFFTASVALFSCSGKKTRDQYPVSHEEGGPVDPVLVKKLYDVKCALCHGFDGKQQYAGAKNLSLSTLDKAQTIHQITEGKGAMPPQKDVLSEEQIAALADFVMTLRTN
jgi:mono/diheme cytochrome c family protein